MRRIGVLLGVVVLFLGLAGTAIAQVPVSQFDAILAQQIVATHTMTTPALTATAATIGTLNSTSSNLGASSVTTLSATGHTALVSVGYPVSAQQTVTTSSTISPTSAFVAITAAGAVTVGDIGDGVNGQILTLVNAGTNAITVPDSGSQRLAGGNVALGQYDTLMMIWYANAWTQLATANN